MASRTMVTETRNFSAPRKLLALFRPQETYWDSLSARTKEECVNRQASRKLGGLDAFDPAGPLRERWDKEIYPRISEILNQERATILKRVKTDVAYAFHLYMIEQQAVIVPAFVTICINTEIANEVVRVAKKHLKNENVGLKYLIFKSYLSSTGAQGSNLCGTAIEFSVFSDWPRSRGGLPCMISTVGGCILVGTEAFGLTTAHSFGGAPSTSHENLRSSEETMWVSDSDSDSDEESGSYDTGSSNSIDTTDRQDRLVRVVPDNIHPVWELSISDLAQDVSTETLKLMLSFTSSLLSVDILYFRPAKEGGSPTGIARFSDAVDAAEAQIFLCGLPNAARDAKLRVDLRQVQFADDTLDLRIYGWTQHGGSDNLQPLLTDGSSLIVQQSSLENDWLLVPLERAPSAYCNRTPVLNNEHESLPIKGFLNETTSEQEVSLCLGMSTPCRAMLRTTMTGLYLPSVKRIIDVYTCDRQTIAGDSGSWIVNDDGYVVGSILATCTSSYIAPMMTTVKSIERQNPGLKVVFPTGELQEDLAQNLGSEVDSTKHRGLYAESKQEQHGRKLAEAAQIYVRALASYERALGPEHILTLDTVNNLGDLYAGKGKLEAAEQMFARAVAGYDKVLGQQHTSTLDTIHDLGIVYLQQAKLDAAEQTYTRALAGYEQVFGPRHTSTLKMIHNFGSLYCVQGRFGEAEKMYDRALAGYERALGPDHVSTLNTVHNLGLLYQARGKPVESERMYRRALAGYEEVLGPGHTSTLHTVYNLSSLIFVHQRRLVEAQRLYVRALAGFEEALGFDHILTLYTAHNLGNLYCQQGRLLKADRMYKQALDGKIKTLGPKHTSTLETLECLRNLRISRDTYAQSSRDWTKPIHTATVHE